MNKNKKVTIIGNWKMFPKTSEEARVLFKIALKTSAEMPDVGVILCPPAVYFGLGADILAKAAAAESRHGKGGHNTSGNVSLGAQDLFYENSGPFTGEISGSLLTQFKVSHSIIGHSERRKQGDTNEIINKKILTALSLKIRPILCIGEESRDENGLYLAEIKAQIEEALSGVEKTSLSKIVIVYEPVWAIGATKAMNPRDVYEMTIFIKKVLIDHYKQPISIPILYGGSVDPENTKNILTEGNVSGLLIGRQSVDPEGFAEIIKCAGMPV